MRIHKTGFVSASLLGSVMLLASCQSSNKKTEADSTATQAPTIDAFLLSKSDMTTSLKMPGELIAYQQVDLYAKVNSFVKKLNADVGSEVNAGQLLATMEAPEIGSQLSGAESRLNAQQATYLASKATYNRLLETSKTPGTVSPNDLELALAKQNADLAQLRSAQAAYKEINDNKNYLAIKAPFRGVITARNVSEGAYVGPSGKGSDLPLFTLQQQDKLRLVLSVPEAYSSYLNKSIVVKFSVLAYPDHIFNAKIARLAGALDSKLRAQRIEMDVENENKTLLPGMVAEAELPLVDNESHFVVPTDAVLNSTQGTFVIKLSHNKAQWMPIRIGRNDNGKTEIFGKIALNDTLQLKATEETRNGQPLNGKITLKQSNDQAE